MAKPFLQAACLPPRRERVQTMRRVLRVSLLPNRAFDIFRLRQLGFRSGDSAPLEGSCATETRRFVLNLIRCCIPSTVGMRCPAAPSSMTVPTVVIMPKKTSGQAQRKRRPRPPWGKLLGGKPIEQHEFIRGEKVDLCADLAQQMQHSKMMRLLGHYGIVAPVPIYPVAGLVNIDGECWYQLALAIAVELDDSLKIVAGVPPGKTAIRWRGREGAELVRFVDILRKVNPKRSINWCLQQVQRRIFPNSYGRMSLKELVVRYHEARKHHRTTKRM
jgi:hypothetical protein